MAEITAAMVKQLREKTDAPMMECKRALTEAGGTATTAGELMEKAEEILRVRLGNKASKAASRVAAEGVVAIHISADQKLGAMIEVNCETDFVAKNDDFLALTAKLAEMVALLNPADVAALAAMSINGVSVEETRKALIGKIGENLSIRRFARAVAKGTLTHAVGSRWWRRWVRAAWPCSTRPSSTWPCRTSARTSTRTSATFNGY